MASKKFIITGETAAQARIPTAVLTVSPELGVIGSVVKLDGRQSRDPDELPLKYEFAFVSVPIGSMVAREGFRTLESGLVTFSPDKVGEYIVSLKVSNGTFDSEEVRGRSSIRAILVPHGRGYIADGKWIWSYIRDVWTQVEGREMFDTLWSVLVQVVGTELLKLYQVDYNKSIRDIQEQFQRRWLPYEPKLDIDVDSASFFLGNTAAGNDALSGTSKLVGSGLIMSANEFVVLQGPPAPFAVGKNIKVTHSRNSQNVGEYGIVSLNATKNGFRTETAFPVPPGTPGEVTDLIVPTANIDFDFQSTTWTIVSAGTRRKAWVESEILDIDVYKRTDGDPFTDVLPGDVVVYHSGPNAGFYRILSRDGATLIVDHAPPSSNDSAISAHGASVYRPVGFNVVEKTDSVTDVVCIPLSSGPTLHQLAPGRVITLNGQTYTVLRANLDMNQVVPVVVVTIDRAALLAGQTMTWRVPHTLVSTSQNFDELGVSAGDTLLAEVTLDGKGPELVLQVTGTDRNRLGFVLSDAQLRAGVVPEIPNEYYQAIADEFGFAGVEVKNDVLTLKGLAKELVGIINAPPFKTAYWDEELDADSKLKVGSLSFSVAPRSVVRNRTLPVSDTVMSIPLLQEYIKQPTYVERDGKVFQIHKDKEYEIPRVPANLSENTEFVIDDENALADTFTFRSGTDVLEVENGDFIDLGISPGDKLFIDVPISLSRTGGYTIRAVASRNKLILDKEIPRWSEGAYVTANIRIVRARTGKFIRFVPGRFTAKKRAPDRLWAEVTFFDNSDAIENNFGVLVALSKEDLAKATNGVSYRQAVAGLMYAYTRGSAIDTIRLGASILLGLPFTEHRGIIRSIEEDYRLDASGVPILGRVLIEDVDDDDQPLGTLRVYTFPVDPSSELAGVDLNPVTKKKWAVDDVVEPFSALAKGVQILDYKNGSFTGLSDVFKLQQYHAIRVRVNDNIFQPKEIALVSDFLKKITPSYVAVFLAKTAEMMDSVSVLDFIKMKLKTPMGAAPSFVDNISTGLPFALMHDAKTLGGIYPLKLDDGFYIPLRGGRDLLTETVDGTQHIRIPSGGLVTPRSVDEFEGPLVVAGDKLLVRSGYNYGLYTIATVTDTEVTLSDGPARGLYDIEDQQFAVLRLVKPMFASGADAAYIASQATVTLTGAKLRTKFVMPGDLLFLDVNGTCTRHTIKVVKESSPGVWDQVEVTPVPASSKSNAAWRIYRPLFMTDIEDTFSVSQSGATNLTTSNSLLKAMADVGDELVIQRADLARLTILDAKTLYVTPNPPTGSYSVKLVKKGFSGSKVPVFATLWNCPKDALYVSIGRALGQSADAQCTNGSTAVSFTSLSNPGQGKVKPGDFLVLLDGGNASVDVGYGAGVFPIVQVTNTNVRLSVPLTSTGAAHWKITRRA